MFSLQGLKKNNIVVHVTCHENGAPYAAEQYRYVEHTQRALREEVLYKMWLEGGKSVERDM